MLVAEARSPLGNQFPCYAKWIGQSWVGLPGFRRPHRATLRSISPSPGLSKKLQKFFQQEDQGQGAPSQTLLRIWAQV